MLTPQTAVLESIIKLIKINLNINVYVAPLPVNGGVTVEVTGGYGKSVSLNKQRQRRVMPFLFLCKNEKQLEAMETLNKIGNFLASLTDFPEFENVQILTAQVKTDTGLVGNDGGFYVYSMITDIEIYY